MRWDCRFLKHHSYSVWVCVLVGVMWTGGCSHLTFPLVKKWQLTCCEPSSLQSNRLCSHWSRFVKPQFCNYNWDYSTSGFCRGVIYVWFFHQSAAVSTSSFMNAHKSICGLWAAERAELHTLCLIGSSSLWRGNSWHWLCSSEEFHSCVK